MNWFVTPSLSSLVFACMSWAVFGAAATIDPQGSQEPNDPIVNISHARDIDTWIDLSGTARPVAILCPDQPPYRQAAQTIAAAIETAGGQRPAVSCDVEAMTPARYNVIALGNVNNNELIARLYFNYYVFEDSILPGPGGYSIRTVYDPYPWHGKGDVMVIGTSHRSDAVKAGTEFAKRIKRGATQAGLDYTLHVSTASSLTAAQTASLENEQTPSFRVFLTSANQYLKTGQEPYARHAIATLHRIVDLYAREPDHDCDWPEETNSAEILATWDAFEECPLVSDDERYQFTLAMLRFMRALVRHVSGYSRIGTDDLVTWNHTTFPLLGLYFGSRYFHDYYGLTEANGHLEKTRACMLAQAKSWKPQEDADSYLTITMRHTIRYCLAEWNLDFFKSGRMRQYADYVIGICDNSGWQSGFGDSGIGRSPALVQAALPLAFWWHRDPGYLWVLQHVSGGKWQNPFHRDVEPKKPDQHIGVRVFPLDAQLYEFTKRRPVYNEPLAPPNVPLGAALDKIVFRESWDNDAQYMLLDGYSRGKHLHYDGNAIIEFVDRGQRWLIDHDYLTRNTTEHNMLSVIQNGRSTQLVPSCAGVVCQSDVGGRVGLVGTEIRDYCGIDWNRYIFWRKGDAFVVLDRMTARKDANYDLDLVWKVEDRGNEKLLEDGAFMARHCPVRFQSRQAPVVTDPEASRGKAVLLGHGTSELSFIVDLPAGEYGLAVRAYGRDTSSDSLFVSTADSEKVMIGTSRLGYGPMDMKRISPAAPRVKFTGRRKQLVSVTLRERPPVRVDKLTFYDADGQRRLVVEAEDATPPQKEDLAGIPAKRFWIKWPDPIQPTVKRSHPKGIVVPVRKLYQRINRRLKTGGVAETANLLYTDETTQPADYRIDRIGAGAVLLRGNEDALCAVRGAQIDDLEFDADMLYISPSRIAWTKGRSLRCGEASVVGSGVSNMELDLADFKTVAMTPDGQPVQIQAEGVSPDLLRQVLASWATNVVTVVTRKQASSPIALPAWTVKLGNGEPVRRLKLADLDQDGASEILVAAGNSAFALGAEGDLRWSYMLDGACFDLEAGELNVSKGPEVAVAGGDTYGHLLDCEGKLLSKCQIRGAVWNQNFGDRAWQAYTVAVRDLDRDGQYEILLGTQNMELHAYDAFWNQLFRSRRAVLHGSIDFHTIDADLDGKLEIFATDHYGRVQVFRHDGSKAGAFYSSIGDMQATLVDLDGDGRVELVYGSSTGDLLCAKFPDTGVSNRGARTLWRFDNFGYGVNRLRSADLDADGTAEVILASQTGYLYVLDGHGRVKWQDRAGTDIVEALVLQDKREGEAPAEPRNDGRASAQQELRPPNLTASGVIQQGPVSNDSQPRLAYFDRSGVLSLATGDGRTRKSIALDVVPIVAVQHCDSIVVGAGSQVLSFKVDDLWTHAGPE